MQFQGQNRQTLGVVFDCAMGTRIDDALALAMLYGLQAKGQARVISVTVSRPNLKAAIFCDVLARFYFGGPAAIGLTLAPQMAVDSPMVTAPLSGPYPRGIRKLNDTADPVALIRNALSAQADRGAVVVATGPTTNLMKVLEIAGSAELIERTVRCLVLAAPSSEVPAAWPTPVVLVGPEVGDALPFPGAAIEKDFAWATAHPVVDAYRAFQPMPYDAPSTSMAAVLYAVRPDDGYFRLTAASQGKYRNLVVDAAAKDKVIEAYVALASAKPVPRRRF